MKQCSKCKKIKKLKFFSKDKRSKDGCQSNCVSCNKKYYKENREKINKKCTDYYETNKDEILEYQKEYNTSNKDKIRNRKKRYYKNHRSKLLKQHKIWSRKNKERIRKYQQQYNKKYKVKIKDKKKKYYKTNKKKIQKNIKKYRKQNKKAIHVYEKEYQKNRFKTNINYKLGCLLRGRLYQAIRNNQKTGSAVKDLGCTIPDFKKYIEQKFYSNMSWDNWGSVWELDHIKPLHKFDLPNRKQLLKAVHYTNLQPLTIEDHRKKTVKDLAKIEKALGLVTKEI
jgi:hypothetical protein